MLRRDERLLMEAYSSIHNNKRDFKPVPAGFIYFPDEDQVFTIPKDSPDEGQYLGNGDWGRKELALDDWEKVRIGLGEDIITIKEVWPMAMGKSLPGWVAQIPYIDEDNGWRWYFVPDVFPEEHSFEAYIPHAIDKYKVDRETKDAWREVVGEL
jgi:hypothetical protein